MGMFGLSMGVSRVGDTLPLPVYGLLSGLNSATVGIAALAAMQLAQMALVFFGSVGSMLYMALWYFPVLMIAAGGATVISDFRLLYRLYSYALRKQRPAAPKSQRKSAPEMQAEPDAIRSLTVDDL